MFILSQLFSLCIFLYLCMKKVRLPNSMCLPFGYSSEVHRTCAIWQQMIVQPVSFFFFFFFFFTPASTELGTLGKNIPSFLQRRQLFVSPYLRFHFKGSTLNITKTCLYNSDPLKPHFYIVKLGFTGVYIIFLILLTKHRLWVLVRTASPRRF